MLAAARRIVADCAGCAESDFALDDRRLRAVLYDFAVLGEAAAALPQEFRDQHAEIPWPAIRNMRNVIVHVYFGVSARIVHRTATDDVPELIERLETLLAKPDTDA